MDRFSHWKCQEKLDLYYLCEIFQVVDSYKGKKLEYSDRYQLGRLQKELKTMVNYIQQKYTGENYEYQKQNYKVEFLNLSEEINKILLDQYVNQQPKIENTKNTKNTKRKIIPWLIGASLFVAGYLIGIITN